MTAGSGIIHQEMPKGDESGLLRGFQLWANLPASHKMMTPRYRGVKSDAIPEVMLNDGIRVRVIAGTLGEVQGPVQDVMIDPEFLDVNVPRRTAFCHTTIKGHTVFAYIIEGEGRFDQAAKNGVLSPDFASKSFLGAETLVTFEDGEEIIIVTGETPVRFILVSGRPLKEPVAWRGPIVMNTQNELNIAFEEYEKGTFIKHP